VAAVARAAGPRQRGKAHGSEVRINLLQHGQVNLLSLFHAHRVIESQPALQASQSVLVCMAMMTTTLFCYSDGMLQVFANSLQLCCSPAAPTFAGRTHHH
jgi:hypothetical protein